MSEAGYAAAAGRHGGGRAISFLDRDPFSNHPALGRQPRGVLGAEAEPRPRPAGRSPVVLTIDEDR